MFTLWSEPSVKLRGLQVAELAQPIGQRGARAFGLNKYYDLRKGGRGRGREWGKEGCRCEFSG